MGDADYMLEHGLDPFVRRSSTGEVVEYECGLNPLYERDGRERLHYWHRNEGEYVSWDQTKIPEPRWTFKTFKEANEFAKAKAIECADSDKRVTLARSHTGDGFVCDVSTRRKPEKWFPCKSLNDYVNFQTKIDWEVLRHEFEVMSNWDVASVNFVIDEYIWPVVGYMDDAKRQRKDWDLVQQMIRSRLSEPSPEKGPE